MNAQEKNIYRFGSAVTDGDGSMRDLLGGKGAGLAEMTLLSVPVPPGFTISTEVCRHYLEHGTLPPGLATELDGALRWLESAVGRRFGDAENPLLVSVRSGAPVSMPGMMDTILNVGLNRELLPGITQRSGCRRFALDSYRRLLQMFGTVVMGVPKQVFHSAFENVRTSERDIADSEVPELELSQIIEAFEQKIVEQSGRRFPQNPKEQLGMAIEAVFDSWQSERAQYYRKLNHISDRMGTAVTVQAMVFGNRTHESGTGVGFTRNPSTGEKAIFAEYLTNAQGEDIVAGVRTPLSITELAQTMPAVYDELTCVVSRLEEHFRDVQDFEFTIENGKLFLLQTRTAKLAPSAAVRIAVDMVKEGLITKEEAFGRIDPSILPHILAPQLDLTGNVTLLAEGVPASAGAACGRIALSSKEAIAMAARGDAVILVTEETSAEDIHGMAVSVGFVTARGGATSHAALVARGMGKCCITGARGVHVDAENNRVRMGERDLVAGDQISIEGGTGRIFEGKVPLCYAGDDHPELDLLLAWAADVNGSKVRANADTPEDAAKAMSASAAGIGLCRTEHMFFKEARLAAMRSMILANSTEDRVTALDILLPMQQRDFEELLRSMAPLPVTIRLVDPPLHEFLPSVEEMTQELAQARSDENWERFRMLKELRQRVDQLAETNPMMGHRGCRLSLTYPEILKMQVRAILQASLVVAGEGLEPAPEIMVPLVACEQEMAVLAGLIYETAEEVFAECGARVSYAVGTMIELPRAAVCAAKIAKHVSFMSFGTNDLTQMTFGFSRDDAHSFMASYLEQGILKVDPFLTIDQEGVGALMKMAICSARRAHPKIKIGVCGEHGGDPESIGFFHSLGVDYVSCSPARLKTAHLAMARSVAPK